jgi:hypothetical protein
VGLSPKARPVLRTKLRGSWPMDIPLVLVVLQPSVCRHGAMVALTPESTAADRSGVEDY